jgi:hypothetical protein
MVEGRLTITWSTRKPVKRNKLSRHKLSRLARSALLVSSLEWSVGGASETSAQTRTKSQAVLSPIVAVDTSVTVVPAAYSIQDAAVIFHRLETLRRGTYESTPDLELRVRKALNTHFLSLPAGGTFCATPEFTYDADSAVATVSVRGMYDKGLAIQCTETKSDRYVGYNAFGVRANVLRRHYLEFRIVPSNREEFSPLRSLDTTVHLPMDRTKASVVFPRLQSLLVFEPSASPDGFVAQRDIDGDAATINLPIEVETQVRTIYARSAFLWIYDRIAREVIRKVRLF